MSSQLLVEKVEKVTPVVPTPSPQAAGAATSAAVVLQRPLFSQSFVELSGDDAKRRRMTTGTTFLVQAAIMTVLVILPLVMIDALPTAQLASFLTAPPPPPPPPPPPAPALKVVKVTEVMNGQLLTPSRIPKTVKMIKEEETPSSSSGGVIGGVEGGVPGGSAGGVLGSLISSTKTSVPEITIPKRLRVSTGVSEGLLIQRVEPVYPIIAKRARIEGTVQLTAVISTDGTIENLRLISGHPMLVEAAMNAVKQWRYRPYILNGGPLEVETTVYVIFRMTS
jgi:periplasmic protein TonB